MQIILAPSKTMNMTRPFPPECHATVPELIIRSNQIAKVVRNVPDIAGFMHVSQPIADRVQQMYKDWGKVTAPAIFAYIGDVYKWFYAETLSVDDINWAQQRIFIMSGLYGAVRPLDLVSPYRLEMKAKLSVNGSKDLYDFWDNDVAKLVDTRPGQVICNLSSDEYAKVVTRHTKKRVVTPVFIDKKVNGVVGTVPIYSKMMRGVMARWIIDHRVDSPKGLQGFTSQGYAYDATKSTPDYPAFYREDPKPIRF